LEWVDDNQAGRRNLTTDQKAIIIGRRYNREKKNTNDNLKQNSPKGQNVPSVNTAEKFAKENHINEKTVKRYGKIATEFDTMEVKNPSVAKEVFSGETKFKDVKEKQPKKNPAEKKAIEQPTPTDDTNVSTEDNTSIGALETGVESKDIVVKPDNKPWISPTENTLMNLIVKTQRKIIDYQEKRSEVAKKIVAHQKLSKEHTDKVVSNIDKKAKEEKEKLNAADVKKLRTLTLKSDAITFDITEALKELGSQIVFHCDFKTVKADDFKAKISIDNSMKEIESPAKFEFTEEHIENLIKQNELIEKTNAEILDLEMNAKSLLNDADLMDKISDIKYQLGHKLTKEK
jgi:polyhydroxyalkanoate synthesis regulator phasin